MNYNFTMPGFSPGAGHFTQVVWKSSSQLGCAAQVCADGIKGSKMPSGTLVICRQVTDRKSCDRGGVKVYQSLYTSMSLHVYNALLAWLQIRGTHMPCLMS